MNLILSNQKPCGIKAEEADSLFGWHAEKARSVTEECARGDGKEETDAHKPVPPSRRLEQIFHKHSLLHSRF